MGEVYRATDTTLHRDVAIKVLPPDVAQDPERLARFRREAHLLAALNHPTIAAIYGLEESGGKPFLALELVEGEDLKERLAKGPIPVGEALEIAEQIAEALEEAHGKGIVHRDLKPANVKLTPDGKVKVLDFGLAKAWSGDTPDGSSPAAALSQSPTLAHSGTVAGVILGTAAYMSPEQARGKRVDRKADVWSFGVLLWEMLTGRSLFAGDTVTDVIAAVVTKEPDLDALPAATPRAVRRLLGRCLRKDPRTRLPDIGAARLELQEAIAGTSTEAEAPAAPDEETVRTERRGRTRERWAWGAAFLLAAGLAGYLAAGRWTETPEVRPAAHFVVDPPEGRGLLPWGAPAVSRDGRQVAFVTGATEASQTWTLWTRPLESVGSRELPGTEQARMPFWSPDSRSIGFFTENELRRIDLDSGAVQKISGLPPGFPTGGDWAEDGTLLFSAGGMSARLYTVSASGGEARPLTALDESRGETAHWWPRLLPDGRHFLFQVAAREPERQGLYLASLDEPGARRRLLPTPTRADYQAGHLLFVRDETLLAQPFDVTRGSPTGEPSAVAFSVAAWREVPSWGWFSAQGGGLLAYAEGAGRESELVWFDRKGSRLGAVGNPGNHIALALSPDEKQVAVQAIAPGADRADIWTIDLARGVGTRQTSDDASENSPTWEADGRAILFASNREGSWRVYRKTLRGNEPETPFGKATQAMFPESVSPDGKELLYHLQGESGHAIGALSLTGDEDPEPILERPYPLDEPQLSPDGRWLTYGAQETGGGWEVYIEPYKRPGERMRVSPDGGGQPKWRGDGKELFYVTRAGFLMAVEVRASSDRLEVGLPVRLFAGVQGSGVSDTYAVTRDGQRFLAIVPTSSAARGKVHVVTNWTSLLERK
jgi:Tol biopolymer transport system component